MKKWQNKEEFKERVSEWAIKMDVQIHIISMRSMKNKWASYTKTSNLLIFNTKLLDMEKELADYVIVHELLHFRTPNHGKLWKSYMQAYLGNYEKLKERLINKLID